MNDFERLAQQLYHQLPPKFDANALAAVLAGGLLAKDALVDGAIYWGWCRNSSRARWKAARSRFVYRRTKFGSIFDEDIVHPQDDEGFDIFIPVARIEEGDQETPARGSVAPPPA